MIDIVNIFSKLSEACAMAIPVLTLFGLIIPKTRKFIGKKLKKFLGIENINNEIKEMKLKNEELLTKMDNHLLKDQDKMQAQMFILKDSLMRAFHFYIDRGYITLEELDTLQDVYNSYRIFGGNGLFKAQWEDRILKLPNKPPEK